MDTCLPAGREEWFPIENDEGFGPIVQWIEWRFPKP